MTILKTPRTIYACILLSLNLTQVLLISPITPALLLKATHNNESEATLINGLHMSIMSFCAFLSSVFIGIGADRYGRKPFLFIALVGSAIGALGYFLLHFWEKIWIPLLAGGIAGFLGNPIGLCYSYAADLSTCKDRTVAFGMISGAMGVSFVIGPIVGGYLGDISYLWPFVAVGSFVLCSFVIFFLIPESLPEQNRCPSTESIAASECNVILSYGLLFRTKFLGFLTMIFFIYEVSQLGAFTATSMYYSTVFNWSPLKIGLANSFSGLFMTLATSVLIRPMTRFWGERKTLISGMFFSASAAVAFIFIKDGYFFYIVLPFRFLGTVGLPMMQAIISRKYPPEIQGKVMCLLNAVHVLSGCVGPLGLSSLFSFFTSKKAPIHFPQIIWVATAFLEYSCLLSIIVLFLVFKKEHKFVEVPPSPTLLSINTLNSPIEENSPLLHRHSINDDDSYE